jgi:hypothetical protein
MRRSTAPPLSVLALSRLVSLVLERIYETSLSPE